MESIKWVFKCIKRQLDLINTPDSWPLCSCAVNDHLSEERGYYFEYVFKRCFEIAWQTIFFLQLKCSVYSHQM